MQRILDFGHAAFSSLKVRNYRLYFIGQSISLSGTWMQAVAQGWLTLQLTGSGTQLGAVFALQFVPLLIFGPWGGAIVDRVDKRHILYWTNSIFGILAVGLSIFIFTDLIQVWMLYASSLFTGVVRLFDNPARQAFVSELVDSSRIKNAVSLNSTSVNLARAVGPTIGGAVIASLGIAFCFFINALSYVAVIAMLARLRGGTFDTPVPREKQTGDVARGFRYVGSTPLIRDILIVMAVIGTLAYEFEVSLPLLAKVTFGTDVSGYASLLAAFGAGSVAGGLFAAGWHTVKSRHLIISIFLFGASILTASLAPTLGLAVAGMFVVGFFSINVTSQANTTIQLASVPEMRGRVMALWTMAMVGSTAVGGPLIGLIGEQYGARAALATGGIAAFAAVGYAILTLLRKDGAGCAHTAKV